MSSSGRRHATESSSSSSFGGRGGGRRGRGGGGRGSGGGSGGGGGNGISGGRGRGGGRRGRGGGRGSGGDRSNNSSHSRRGNSHQYRNGGSSSTSASASASDPNGREGGGSSSSSGLALPEMRDEDVLIAFMPYLKGDSTEASRIYDLYQNNNDQRTFLRAARDLIQRERDAATADAVPSQLLQNQNGEIPLFDQPASSSSSQSPEIPPRNSKNRIPPSDEYKPRMSLLTNSGSASHASRTAHVQINGHGHGQSEQQHQQSQPSGQAQAQNNSAVKNQQISVDDLFGDNVASMLGDNADHLSDILRASLASPPDLHSSPSMQIMEKKMANLLSDDDDPIYSLSARKSADSTPIGSGVSTPRRNAPGPGSIFDNYSSAPHQPQPPSSNNQASSSSSAHSRQLTPQQTLYQSPFPENSRSQISSSFLSSFTTTPNNIGHPLSLSLLSPNTSSSQQPFSSLLSPARDPIISSPNPSLSASRQHQSAAFPSSLSYLNSSHPTPASSQQQTDWIAQLSNPDSGSAFSKASRANISSPLSHRERPINDQQQQPPGLPPPSAPVYEKSGGSESTKPTQTPKKEYQPKRLWAHLKDQPGQLFANDVSAAHGTIVVLRPRQELTAKWMLPLAYLRQYTQERGVAATTVREALANLTVGLFRRGCTENGSQASIVSKEVLALPGDSRPDYPFQVLADRVVGTIPFYSPRTPGHVVFRLYWQDSPVKTLATGPALNVRITESDFESSIRFILSNFKGKKVNPTSLSSLNSLGLVLEQFQLSPHTLQLPSHVIQQQLEGSGRAVWGCICEARKVLDACAAEYQKTTAKLIKLEENVTELRTRMDEEEEADEQQQLEPEDSSTDELPGISPTVLMYREKQRALMSGRASCERKWRDSQLAFASILRSVVSNSSVTAILRRDLVSKMRLEYELWCPLCEEFAVLGRNGESNDDGTMWYQPLQNFPNSITGEHFRMCAEARILMQQRVLGFEPNASTLEAVLFASASNNKRQMNPTAVKMFNQLSSALGQLYQSLYATSDVVHQQREQVRALMERCVEMCDGFPAGTKVVIFGSAANGFGSPKSDVDMCLQLPSGAAIVDESDRSGARAMSDLAALLKENGLQDVDDGRLTARIPVIKFNCPLKLLSNANGNFTQGNDVDDDVDKVVECDLSMHNPLAVLNTSLLRTYADITPITRVLACVVKRWAKMRDINDPSRHTLSSYGYIIMLIHFLTFHQRSGDGLIVPMATPTDVIPRNRRNGLPLLPNLQWMDPSWLNSDVNNVPTLNYKELTELPKKLVRHPLEEKVIVNTYYFRPEASQDMSALQRVFAGQDLSIAILLASFFRYYAYDFDYKRYVVSLHSTALRGLVERETKAELDGWRNYSAALTIEDPFETFYDVAHVLRGGHYHRIRREFAVAYGKIVDLASGKIAKPNMSGSDVIDWICEPIANDAGSEGSETKI